MKKRIIAASAIALCSTLLFSDGKIQATVPANAPQAVDMLAEKMEKLAAAMSASNKTSGQSQPGGSTVFIKPQKSQLEKAQDSLALLRLQKERETLTKPDASQYPEPTGYYSVSVGPKSGPAKATVVDDEGNTRVLSESAKYVEKISPDGVIYKTGSKSYLYKPIAIGTVAKSETKKEKSISEYSTPARPAAPLRRSRQNAAPVTPSVSTGEAPAPTMDQVLKSYGVR